MTITEFLLARIAEDEAAVRDALTDGRSTREPEPWLAVGWSASEHPGPVVLVDPARFLAEVEAKRRIVGIYRDVWMTEPEDGYPSVPVGGAGPETYYETIQHLASVYSDHPDYDEAWRP